MGQNASCNRDKIDDDANLRQLFGRFVGLPSFLSRPPDERGFLKAVSRSVLGAEI